MSVLPELQLTTDALEFEATPGLSTCDANRYVVAVTIGLEFVLCHHNALALLIRMSMRPNLATSARAKNRYCFEGSGLTCMSAVSSGLSTCLYAAERASITSCARLPEYLCHEHLVASMCPLTAHTHTHTSRRLVSKVDPMDP